MTMYGTTELGLILAAVAFCCLSGLHLSGAEAQSYDDKVNFEAEPYYPMLRRHWNKYRQISPKTRSLISIPVPRAGKRSGVLSSLQDLQEPSQLENAYALPYNMGVMETAAADNRQKNKKFWPKYWSSFVKSPIYWPAGSRPYWRI